MSTRQTFAGDTLNLTLASPSLNRHEKSAKDVAEWLPALNQCWYVNQVVLVKRKYGLSMDQAEAQRAQAILNGCSSTEMQFVAQPVAPDPQPQTCPTNCTQAHEMGMSNMTTDHACYQPKFDRDNDGVGCER